MRGKELLEYIEEYITEKAYYPTGFEDAIIGIAEQFGKGPCILLDKNKCINILMKRDNMSEQEAIEFYEYNILGSWVGENTPVFGVIFDE